VRARCATCRDPHLVSIEDGWQIGYLLEKLENDWVAVFLPQAPTPMSGDIMYLPINRVRPLGITMIQAMSIVKAIGVGSGAASRMSRRPLARRCGRRTNTTASTSRIRLSGCSLQ
jgi:uncharacterized membrane protein